MMNNDIRSWKLGLGVGILLVACVFTAGWVRSYTYEDRVIVQDAGFIARSAIGGIEWNWKYYYEVSGPAVEWQVEPIPQVNPEYFTAEYGFPTVSYWSIVFPLIVFAAYLLISKSRPKSV